MAGLPTRLLGCCLAPPYPFVIVNPDGLDGTSEISGQSCQLTDGGNKTQIKVLLIRWPKSHSITASLAVFVPQQLLAG